MIVALFPNQPALLRAAAQLRAAVRGTPGAAVETYTAEEPSENQDAPDTTLSRIPLAMLAVAVLTLAGMMLMQAYATTIGYPIGVGGRPAFAWPAFVPNAFETAVLAAILAGLAGFLAANRMPRLYDPVDESALVRAAMRGANVLTLRGLEPAHARTLLVPLAPLRTEELPG